MNKDSYGSARLDSDDFINKILKELRFSDTCANEGRLMLVELCVKANAGFYNSHTEEEFLGCFGLLKKGRKLNAKGGRFIHAMLYKHSNYQSDFVKLSLKHRRLQEQTND